MMKRPMFLKKIFKKEKERDLEKLNVAVEKLHIDEEGEDCIQAYGTSLEDVFQECKIDRNLWHVSHFNTKQISNGKFLWTVFFKRKSDVIDWDKFKEELKVYSPKVKKIKHSGRQQNLLLECSFPDLHYAKLSWAEETNQNYDSKIAAEELRKGIYYTIDSAKKFQISQILLPIGNDFFQSDSLDNTTTAGTSISVDTRHHKMFREGYQLVIEIIDQLKEIAPVHILSCPGNHDQACSLYMSELLDCYYHKDDNVTVDTRAILRKYYQWGKNLIGFTHGNKEKINDLAVLMATEEPKLWAETKYRLWHIGHFHTRRMFSDEKCGVTVEVLPSLSGVDSWHFEKGYTGNIRGMLSSVYDKEIGLIAKLNYNL
jgi:hypothetical protein